MERATMNFMGSSPAINFEIVRSLWPRLGGEGLGLSFVRPAVCCRSIRKPCLEAKNTFAFSHENVKNLLFTLLILLHFNFIHRIYIIFLITGQWMDNAIAEITLVSKWFNSLNILDSKKVLK
jgi:hypothetical protein